VAQNLAWRALAAYRAATGWPRGAEVHIDKRIPVGGGLGGGSADAAAVLRGLDALAPSPIGLDALAAVGASLGADVPFLVHGAPLAWAWGRGDRLLIVPPLPARDVYLVPQAEGVPTADAYRWLAESGGGSAVGSARYAVEALSRWDRVTAMAHNDFTAVVAPRHAGVRSALASLSAAVEAARGAGADDAMALMSGSGATCFAILPAGTPVGVAGVWTRTLAGVVGGPEVG
jgi:4-diphosphocytidyl-2-C-methyl-D-erythritol kinase